MQIRIILFLSPLFLISCKTNIVDHYDCNGKEELLSKTFIQCLELQKDCLNDETKTISKNPIIACGDSTKELLCSPVYKEIF